MSLILPASFSADFINRFFYPEEWARGYLSRINSGRCYDWAYKAFCLWSDTDLWTTERHAWIKCGDLFFDSESPSGVQSFDRIPCNGRAGWDEVEPTAMSSEAFQIHWNNNGGGRRNHWHELVETIKALGLPIART